MFNILVTLGDTILARNLRSRKDLARFGTGMVEFEYVREAARI